MQSALSRIILVMSLSLSLEAVANSPTPQDNWSGFDKVLHFSGSTVLSAGTYGVFSFAFDEPWQRAIAASAFTLTIGSLKEIADATNGSIFSYHDMAYNIFGTLAGVGLALGTDYAISVRSTPQTPLQVTFRF